MGHTERGAALLGLARQAIERAILPVQRAQPERHRGRAAGDHDEAFQAWGASFVTLTENGQLRGCIGTPEAWRPLKDDVQANAVAAALRDPRFAPLQPQEWPSVRVEVSVLSPLEAMECTNEAQALAKLRPSVDGLALACGRHRATFLPQVWEQLPTPALFLAQLKRKAGLPTHFWSPDLRLQRFTVHKWKEPA